MALDPYLFDTYKQYKAGTEKVMSWLARRAQEANLLSTLMPTASECKDKGRLKVKARATQKETGQKHQVPLADIPQIVKLIGISTKLTVPESIIRTLEEVIEARSACNNCFE